MFLFLHWELVYIYSRQRKLLLLLEEEIKICVTTLVKEKMKIYIFYLRVPVLRKNRHIYVHALITLKILRSKAVAQCNTKV